MRFWKISAKPHTVQQGLVDGKDTVLSAGSRTCPHCLGGGNADTYICSAETAMASAIAGYICPEE